MFSALQCILPSISPTSLAANALQLQAFAAHLLLAQADPLAGGGSPITSGGAVVPVVNTQAASSGGGAGPGGWISWAMMLGVFGIFYFMVLRPQQKKASQHKQFLDALQPDSSVVTSGGIYGKIVSIQDQIVTVEIADRVRIRVHKSHVAGAASNAAEALAGQQK